MAARKAKGDKGVEGPPKLLSRDDFRDSCHRRDRNKCIFCTSPGTEAHHIVERKLFNNGGYYLENAALVCNPHHMECEMTTKSCEEVRAAAGITRTVLPEHLDPTLVYDKWANVILPDGKRLRGEMFHLDPVQKMMTRAGLLGVFEERVIFPQIWHLPHSEGVRPGELMLADCSGFEGRNVVVMELLDGEMTSLYPGGVKLHAHSVTEEYGATPGREHMVDLHDTLTYQIPAGHRFCGWNLATERTVHYTALPALFVCAFMFDDRNVCLPCHTTASMAEQMEPPLPVPRVLYEGVWDEAAVHGCLNKDGTVYGGRATGYVVRLADEFHFGEFRRSVALYRVAGLANAAAPRPNQVMPSG